MHGRLGPDRRRSDRRLLPYRCQVWIEGVDDPMRVRELGPGGMVIESARSPRAR